MTKLLSAREAVGPAFSIEAMRVAQAKSWEAVERIVDFIKPGKTEREAIAQGEVILKDLGMELPWHPLLIRFGTDTLKLYSDRARSDVILGADDIFFIDMGPVFGGHEGDVGATYVTGADAEMLACARDVKVLFDQVTAAWNGGAVTGRALYDAAEAEAKTLGWVLNLDIKGHRVSDYPHSVHNGGKLGAFNAVPSAGVWILEIQIRHPARPFGAFYEDLLV